MFWTIIFKIPFQNKKSIPPNTAKASRENALIRTNTITITVHFNCDASLQREVEVCFVPRKTFRYERLFLLYKKNCKKKLHHSETNNTSLKMACERRSSLVSIDCALPTNQTSHAHCFASAPSFFTFFTLLCSQRRSWDVCLSMRRTMQLVVCLKKSSAWWHRFEKTVPTWNGRCCAQRRPFFMCLMPLRSDRRPLHVCIRAHSTFQPTGSLKTSRTRSHRSAQIDPFPKLQTPAISQRPVRFWCTIYGNVRLNVLYTFA